MESSISPLSQFKNKDAESWEKAISVFEKITEQSQFAEIAGCEHISVYFRIRAIKKLDKHVYQDLLTHIAVNIGGDFARLIWPEMRFIAAQLVENEQIRQSVFTNIAQRSDTDLRFKAAELLTNQEVRQSVYANIVKTHSGFYRALAIYYLDANLYQSLLEEIAETDDDKLVRKAVMKKLNANENQDGKRSAAGIARKKKKL